MGCSSKEQSSGYSDKDTTPENIETATLENENIKETEAKYETEMIVEPDSLIDFLYSKEYELTQALSVKWLSLDTVEFQLKSENMLCEYSTSGIAVRESKSNGEIDKDIHGVSYLALEYLVQNGGDLWSLRIEHPKRERAKITYVHGEQIGECDPDSNVIMRKNAF